MRIFTAGTNLFIFLLALLGGINSAAAQTCSVGSASLTTEFAVTATGGAANTNNSLGTVLASGTALSNSNSATVSIAPSSPLILDFGRIIPAATPIDIAAARVSAGTATATVEYSTDNVTYTSLGATISSAVSTSTYYNYISPAGGFRYIRITVTSAGVNLFIDGARIIQNFALTATGGSANPANATGPALVVNTILSTTNSASVDNGSVLNLDLGRFAAAGSILTVAAARNGVTNSTATVAYSVDGVTYTNFGTSLSLISGNSTYTNFTVPTGGIRYLRITGTAASSFIDGIIYTHYCPYLAVSAVNDQQVVQNPGTAYGNVLTNDQVPTAIYSMELVTNVSNGTLNFNATNGTYSYSPNSGFQGVDDFTYRLCDAGPDGNINTTGDNVCDVATVYLRTMFNCKSTLFYVPIPENEARDFLEDININNNDATQVYMGLSILSEGLIVYDQWEDGYEANINAPVQSTTQIWGDGNLTNGVAPGYPTDLIPAGSTIIISNLLTSGHNNTSNYNPNAAGADNTLQATVDFDGKDKIFVAGEASLTKFAWGSSGTLSMTGGPVPPTRDWGTSFRLPVGRNTGAAPELQFQVVNFTVIAQEANTVLTIDHDANGTTDVTVTLNEGETYYFDSRNNGAFTAVNQGATINATKPVQVYLMTGQVLTGTIYHGRNHALLPTASLSTAYYMPGVPIETMRVYFYNPTASAITVTRTTTAGGGGTTTISVPANGSASQDVSNSGFGYRYSSTSAFNILTTVDINSGTSDWGFMPVPSTNMSPIALVSFAEGSDPTNAGYGTNNYAQILVTPACNTYLYVDLNGDGVPDKVSFNDDIDVTDAAITIGGVTYNETTSNAGILLNQYQTITIGGPAGTLNGARIWTKTAANNTGTYGCDIAVVYGQNGGPNTAPNIDAGYTLPKTSLPLDVSISNPSSVCPGNASSYIVPTILNGAAPFTVLLVNITTAESQYITTSSTNFNLDARNPGDYILKINDNNCLSFESSFTITKSTNCGTASVNDQNSTWQDINVSGAVLINDFDPEGNSQTFSSFLTQGTTPGAPISTGATLSGVDKNGSPVATAGTLTFAANGTYTFDPAPNFTGTVTVPYKVCDNGVPSFCDTAYLLITVDPYPAQTNSVIANNDENLSYGAPVNNNILLNDADPQENSFTVSSFTLDTDGNPATPNVAGTVGGPAVQIGGESSDGIAVANAGTFVLNADGSYTFTPSLGFAGSVDIPYTICDNATPQACATAILHIDVLADENGAANDAPVAGDDFETTFVNLPVSNNVLSNDYDPNAGNTFTVTQIGSTPVTGPTTIATTNGSITIQPNGSYTYTPNPGYVGPDQVTYNVCDNQSPALCTRATLYFLTSVSNSTDAVNDENSTWQDVNVSGGVVANDFDAENNTQTFGTFLAQGAVPGSPISSGATVSGVDKTGAPIANAGALTFDANGNYTFDPSPTFTGTVTVPYRICDNGNLSKCDTAYLTITVDPLPSSANTVIANNDENISYGAPVSSNVTLNDDDPQLTDAFTVSAVNGVPANVNTSITVSGIDRYGNPVANAGTLVINTDGSYTYTPATGFVGSINVPYTITDNNVSPASATAILHIDVLKDPNGPANDPPFGGGDFKIIMLNTLVSGSVLLNDFDPNGNTLTVTPQTTTIAGVGTFTLLANGDYTFLTYPGYVGPSVFYYEVCDGQSPALCANAEIHFLAAPLSSLPVTGLELKARLSGNNAFIDWKTESETNSDHFVVERSVDNRNFTAVGTVAAAGNSVTRRNYTFTDNLSALMSEKAIYYRIRQVDIDARFIYSRVVVVRLAKTVGIQIWPNPFSSYIAVNIASDVNSGVSLKLFGANGQLLQLQTRQISRGTTQFNVNNLEGLSKGVYLLQVIDDKGTILHSEKVIKE